MSAYHKLKTIKGKYSQELLKLDGVKAVGIRVLEGVIVVYMDEENPDTLTKIPYELEGIPVEVRSGSLNVAKALDGSNESVHPNTTQNRPLMIGTSIGAPTTSVGTIGAYVWSRKLNKAVLMSNNHIFAGSSGQGWVEGEYALLNEEEVISTRPRMFTNEIGFTLLDGGIYPSSPTLASDYGRYYSRDTHTPVIDTITPTSAKVGDIITITGKHLGTRKGRTKVFIGGKEAQIKSWTITHQVSEEKGYNSYNYGSETNQLNHIYELELSIEAYVPVGATSGVVTIEVEGTPIMSPGRYDSRYRNSPYNTDGLMREWMENQQAAELVDYLPKALNDTNLPPAYGDNALAIPTTTVNDTIYLHGSEYEGDRPHLDPYHEDGRLIVPKGVLTEFVENLVVMKTGRTTGTRMAPIYDPSIDFAQGNSKGLSLMQDQILTRLCVIDYNLAPDEPALFIYDPDYGYTGQKRDYVSFIEGGDSGSGVYLASIDDWNAYATRFWLDKTSIVSDSLVQQAYDSLTSWNPYMFIGLAHSGHEWYAALWSDSKPFEPYEGYFDKLINYQDYYGGLSPYTPTSEPNLIHWDRDQPASATSMGMNVTIYQEHYVTANFAISTNINAELQIEVKADAGSSELFQYTPPSQDAVNFDLFIQGDIWVEAHYDVHSGMESKVEVPIYITAEYTIQTGMTGDAELIPIVYLTPTYALQTGMNSTLDVGAASIYVTASYDVKTEMESSLELGALPAIQLTANYHIEVTVDSPIEELLYPIYLTPNYHLTTGFKALHDIYVQPNFDVQTGFTAYPYVFSIIGTIRLSGQRELNIILEGRSIKNVILKGSVGVTAENQDFSMTAGDSFAPVFPCTEIKYNPVKKQLEETELDLTGLTIKWAVKKRVTSPDTLLTKTQLDGIAVSGTELTIELKPADTLNLTGSYHHECEIVDPSGNVSTIFRGSMYVKPSGV